MGFVVKLLAKRPVRFTVRANKMVTIGRSRDAEVPLDDKAVSRRHCELLASAQGLLVRDLGSRNGTLFNGQRLNGEVLAQPGDQFQVGQSTFLVEGEEADASPTGREPKRPTGRQQGDPVTGRQRPIPPPLDLPTGAERTDGIERLTPEIPGYADLSPLSIGERSTVYRARRVKTGEPVALKVLLPGGAENEVKRFQRSAQALAKLDHPNIVRVVEVGEAGGLPYFAMEYLAGERLSERFGGEPLEVREALSIALQVIRALKLVHNEGVVHRNVCPENVICIPGGVAKLLGFGAAKGAEGGAQSLTNLGEIIGDVSYISPEQARDPRFVDYRTDLYSVGAIMFHAISGRAPFGGANELEVFRMVLAKPAQRLRELSPDVPRSVDDLVARLLEKDPDHRIQTVEILERLLDDALLEVCGTDSGDSSLAFGGGFSGTELLEIVQFIELHRKNGLLTVTTGGLEGEIRFKEGTIVSATAGPLEEGAAALELLQSSEGRFRFRAGPANEWDGRPAVNLRPSALALEVLRFLDETGRRR